MLTRLLFAGFLSWGAGASALGTNCSTDLQNLNASQYLLKSAVPRLLGFEYVRQALERVKTQDAQAEFCVSGIVLSRLLMNPLLLVQIDVHSPSKTVPAYRIRMLYQDAQVQGYHTFGEKPWVGLATRGVDSILAGLLTQAAANLVVTATPVSFDPATIATENSDVDKSTVSVTEVSTPGAANPVYLVSWLTPLGENPYASYPILYGYLISQDAQTKVVARTPKLLLGTMLNPPLEALRQSTQPKSEDDFIDQLLLLSLPN